MAREFAGPPSKLDQICSIKFVGIRIKAEFADLIMIKSFASYAHLIKFSNSIGPNFLI